MSIGNLARDRWVKILCVALSLLLTLAWIGFIFSNSLKSGTASGEQSSKVHEVVNKVAQSLGAKEEISQDTVRSGAHFAEFAILGFLLCLSIASLWCLRGGSRLPRLMGFGCLSLPVCAILAATDEYLQTFSEGRSTELSDAILDTVGALAGIAAFTAIVAVVWWIRTQREKKAKREAD